MLRLFIENWRFSATLHLTPILSVQWPKQYVHTQFLCKPGRTADVVTKQYYSNMEGQMADFQNFFK